MSNKNLPYIIGGVMFLVFLLLLLLANQLRPRHNWEPHLNYESRDPYGLYALEELLKARLGPDSIYEVRRGIRTTLGQADSVGAVNYLYVGSYNYMTGASRDSLLAFVERGNDAYMFCNDALYSFYDYFDDDYCLYPESEVHDSVHLNLEEEGKRLDTPFTMRIRDHKDTLYYSWSYVDLSLLADCVAACDQLGTIEEVNGLNFFRLPHGNGYLYFHLTPLAFSNYHLLRPSGKAYADRVFSYLDDKPLIWDRASRYYDPDEEGFAGYDGINDRQGPLVYILSQPSLRWAWYTMLAAVLIYLFFTAKRRQRAIAVLHPKENTSMEFSQIIGKLYFQHNNNARIVEMKWRYFLEFLRQRYHISTNQTDEAFIAKVSKISGISVEVITEIAKWHARGARVDNVTDTGVIRMHELLSYFYKHCK